MRRRGRSRAARLTSATSPAPAKRPTKSRPQSVQIGLAGQPGVERLQAPGRVEQQRRGVAAQARGVRDLPAQQVHPGAGELIQRPGLRHDQQPEAPCRARRPACWPAPRPACVRPGAPDRRSAAPTLQERRGRRQPAAGLRPARGPLQLDRDLLIRPGGGLGPVPGPPIRIEPPDRSPPPAPRAPPAVRQRRRPVGRRAHQRMPEPHPRAELRQTRLGRRHRRLNRELQPPGRPPDQRRITRRIGRGQQQQLPGRGRAGRPAAAGNYPRSGPSTTPGRVARTRPPARRTSSPVAAPATPAGFPGLGDDLVADPRV